jgi:hypothetical protein
MKIADFRLFFKGCGIDDGRGYGVPFPSSSGHSELIKFDLFYQVSYTFYQEDLMKKILIIFLSLLFACLSLSAEWKELPIGLSVDVPDTWTSDLNKDVLTVTSPDSIVSIVFSAIPAKSLADAKKAVNTELGKIMKKVKVVNKPQDITVNNLTGAVTDGTGEIDGVAIDWMEEVLLQKDRALMIMAFAGTDYYDRYVEEIKAMLDSVKSNWFVHPIGLEVWIPADWKQELDKDTLTVSSPDGVVQIIYSEMPSKDLKAVTGSLNEIVGGILENVEVTDPVKNITVNTLKGAISAGTGNSGDVAMDWMASVVMFKNSALVILGFAGTDLYEEQQPLIDKMLTSIRPSKK